MWLWRQRPKRKAAERKVETGCIDAAFDDIPQRLTYHIRRPRLPDNVVYYAPETDENGVLIGFSLQWLLSLNELQGIDPMEILVAMSDGSLSSDQHGGCGYFAALLSFIDKLDIQTVRELHFETDSEYNKDSPNGVSNFLSMSAAVARRTSIEFCELKGVEYMLESIYAFVLQVFAKVESGAALFGIRVVSISVDSKSVLDWIGGVSVEYNYAVGCIIERIYELIRLFSVVQIQFVFSWVRAHNDTDHNELADDRAKLGMMNQRISLSWQQRYDTRFGRREWAYISAKSVRRQCMKSAFRRTVAKGTTTRGKTRDKIATGARQRQNVCSRFLIDWRISHHGSYSKEKQAMSRREWSMLPALRGGHVPLNGELKFNFRTKQCLQRRCVGGQRESILHFVFRCAHFVEERRDFELKVAAVYRSLDNMPWLSFSESERWRMVLFPLQAEISAAVSDEERDAKMAVRVTVLFALLRFVERTGRFPEKKVNKAFYEL